MIDEYEDEDEATAINIALTVWEGEIGVVIYLTRRMMFDEYGAVEDDCYRANTTADFDEETIRLLEDTLKGMQAELNRLKKNKKEDA